MTDPVEVKIWRYDRADVPEDEEDRMAWLYERWRVMDDWIDQRLVARAAHDRVPA